MCPGWSFDVTKGESYDVYVYSAGGCVSIDGHYRILLDTSADPSLTLEADDAYLSGSTLVELSGIAYIP